MNRPYGIARKERTVGSAALKTRFTPEQYLAFERTAAYKSEYDNGLITAMAGATKKHNQLAGNLYRKLGDQLEDRPCAVYISDIRVRESPTGLYTYPDVVAVCGEAQYLDDEADTLLNPTMIAEVLSPTTEQYDRGGKFWHYRHLPSLKEYVLIAQDKMLVERFSRQGDAWLLTEYQNLDDVLEIASIGCAVSLREIYAKVEIPIEDATVRHDGDGPVGE
jgi:Uma2 family endonuclease